MGRAWSGRFRRGNKEERRAGAEMGTYYRGWKAKTAGEEPRLPHGLMGEHRGLQQGHLGGLGTTAGCSRKASCYCKLKEDGI